MERIQHPDSTGTENTTALEGREVFSSIFSTRNPRDVGAGLSSGLKSISKGVLGGVASLVALPVLGAQQEGVLGAVKGLGLGIVSAVTMVLF